MDITNSVVLETAPENMYSPQAIPSNNMLNTMASPKPRAARPAMIGTLRMLSDRALVLVNLTFTERNSKHPARYGAYSW
jgi:hypothetical protein